MSDASGQTIQVEGIADWAELVSSAFVPLECHGGAADFRGQMRMSLAGGLQFSLIRAPQHRVVRTRRTIARNDPGSYKVGLQLKGGAHLSQDGRETSLAPGDLAIYDTSRPYSVAFEDGVRSEIFVLMFPKELLGVSGTEMSRMTATRVCGSDGLGVLVSPFLTRLAWRISGPDSLVSSRLARNVLDLLETICRERLDLSPGEPESQQRSRLLGVKAWIARHLSQPDLAPDAIAAANHMSVRYLYRLFEHEGTTVSRWTKQRRLEGCYRELADPTLLRYSVSAIAARWGMLEPATFSRAFRAAYGESPRAFRARCLSGRPSSGDVDRRAGEGSRRGAGEGSRRRPAG